MFWTFDPLQALNANLNINTLHARPVEYVVNMYGDTGSDLHAGLGTDRFVVRWDLDSREVAEASEGRYPRPAALPQAPIVNARIEQDIPVPIELPLPDVNLVLIEIPESINETKRQSYDAGVRWRECTRLAFQYYLGRGMAVTGFHVIDARRRAYSMSVTPT
jgi:predicted GNAT superfamily acetyltransferase